MQFNALLYLRPVEIDLIYFNSFYNFFIYFLIINTIFSILF